jgi:hypothetical protein
MLRNARAAGPIRPVDSKAIGQRGHHEARGHIAVLFILAKLGDD